MKWSRPYSYNYAARLRLRERTSQTWTCATDGSSEHRTTSVVLGGSREHEVIWPVKMVPEMT